MSHRLCPVCLGYWLACPVRQLLQNPRRILAPHVRPGMTALDVGCAMGFFSLPLARLVGTTGRVICVDLQPGMLEALRRRARRAGLLDRLDIRGCRADTLGLEDSRGAIDFALAFAVVHEVPAPARLFAELAAALKPGAHLLVAEPRLHVSAPAFRDTVALATAHGLRFVAAPPIASSHSALLARS
jgi:ubiquinone/menaquinone biosynthesis C-methylase UbiE